MDDSVEVVVGVDDDHHPALVYGDSDAADDDDDDVRAAAGDASMDAHAADMALAMALPMGIDAHAGDGSAPAASGAAAAAVARAARGGSVPAATTVDAPSASAGARPSAAPVQVSAVYRWYEIEEGFHLKRKEESSIAKCTTCRLQGKVERKTLVRFSKSVTSNLWRHLKENHPEIYSKHAGEKKSVQVHQLATAKKRGRKKKASPPPPADLGTDDSHDKLLAAAAAAAHDDDHLPSDASSPMAMRKLTAKKQKRSDQFFDDYQLPVSAGAGGGGALPPHPPSLLSGRPAGPSTTSATSAGAAAAGNFSPEKVREAMGYLCLFEMLPFDVCSSHAFRSLMTECSGGSGGYLDESNSFAIFGKEIAFGYAKKLAAEVKVRVLMQMKMTDFAHLMIAEWTPTNTKGSDPNALEMAPNQVLDPGSSAARFLALFAVGLDQEFNAFRRCLHVLPVGNQHGSTTTELLNDDEMKKALDRVVPCKYMPQVLTVEPPSHYYHPFCSANKLAFLESVSTLLQHIVLATINRISVTDTFNFGGSIMAQSAGLWDRRLDCGEFIESSASTPDDFYELPEAEVSTSIMEELPSNLTGHTLRDLITKVMYLLAHLKQSRKSRKVLQKIALEELGVSRELYERVFVASLRDTAVSFGRIYHVLSLAFEMMAALKRYFLVHKEGLSDFSKLVQLATLSQYEWSRIAYLKTLLKPFADATEKLEAERYVISSLIIPSIFTLLGKLRDSRSMQGAVPTEFAKKTGGGDAGPAADTAVDELPEDIVALRDIAYANLSTSFGYLFAAPEADWSSHKRQTFNVLWSATLLDPRTRPFIIKGPLSQPELWDVVKMEAANIAGTKMKDKESGSELSENAMALDDENGQLDGSGSGKAGDLWDDLQANLTSCAQEEMLLSSAKSSLEMAKSTNLLEVEVSFFQEESHISLRANPLEWWQSLRIKYPCLARLARYVLSIPLSVKVEENPVAADNGLVQRARSEMSLPDLCDFLAASMNLRTEKNALFEASNKPMWSTV